jgi:hypothetical protein
MDLVWSAVCGLTVRKYRDLDCFLNQITGDFRPINVKDCLEAPVPARWLQKVP